jgi:hypothetical protein
MSLSSAADENIEDDRRTDRPQPWPILLGGLARMFFLAQIAAIAAGVGRSTGLIVAAAIVLLVFGAILSFKGYSRD